MLSQKWFNKLVGLLLGIKALVVLYYLLTGMQVSVSTWVVPMWLLVVAVLVDAYLAYNAFGLMKKKR